MTMPFHHCAAVVLHWGGQGGYEAGSFVRHLLNAYGSADPENRALLATAYPTLAAAMNLYRDHPDGVAILRGALERQDVKVPADG